MRLETKLGCAIGGLVAIMVLSAVTAQQRIGQSEAITTRLTAERMPLMVALRDVGSHMGRSVRAQESALLLTAGERTSAFAQETGGADHGGGDGAGAGEDDGGAGGDDRRPGVAAEGEGRDRADARGGDGDCAAGGERPERGSGEGGGGGSRCAAADVRLHFGGDERDGGAPDEAGGRGCGAAERRQPARPRRRSGRRRSCARWRAF